MLLRGIKGKRIDGYKSMSTARPVREYLNPEYVYIPLVQGAAKLRVVVNEGDHVNVGTVVALREDHFPLPIYSSVSGTVGKVKKMWHSSARMVEMLEIKNDCLDTVDPNIKACENPSELTRKEIVEKIKNAGLVGLGGAGFPTYVKYLGDQNKDVVLINGVECEPFLTCDYENMLNYPDKLFRGLTYLMKAAGAERGVIAIKNYRTDLVELFQPYLEQYPNISVFLTEDVYPAGWEKYIVEKVLGKTYNRLPAEVGAVVNNSSTCMAVCDAVELGMPQVERTTTITGEGIKEPQNFRIKVGTRVQELVALAGGYVDGLDTTKSYYVAGGPMTGKAIMIDDLVADACLCAIEVLKDKKAEYLPNCLGCGKCSERCPAHLTPTAIRQALLSKDAKLVGELNVNACILCGMCSYVCPSRIELTDSMVQAKDFLRKAGK